MNSLQPLLDFQAKPAELAAELCQLDGFVFFDSSGNIPRDAGDAISIIAALPKESYKNLDSLNEAYEQYKTSALELPDGVKGLSGLIIGYLDYEGGMSFALYQDLLIYNHKENCWYGKGDLLRHRSASSIANYSIGDWSTGMRPQDYMQRVLRIQEYISSGDIYQANLSQKFTAQVSGEHLFGLYQSLRASAPAPMSAYARFEDQEVLCSSPETFLKMEGNVIQTRPIKGTVKRHSKDQNADLEAIQNLQNSPKERAELIMITDLLRNDLGKIAEIGTVSVSQLLKVETLAHVHHLVSVVKARLHPQKSHPEALFSCSPGGSITGAPKKRAMEIIEELEPVKRGIYTGTLGYFGLSGASQFNIVIRTLVRTGQELSYHVGAGIVADSDARAEYEETLQKAEGIRRALLS